MRACIGAQILSFLLCGIVLIFLLARGERFRDALGFIVVLLVASIPIAIEIVRCSGCLPACPRVCLSSAASALLAKTGAADSLLTGARMKWNRIEQTMAQLHANGPELHSAPDCTEY